jgi:hypothetical protein
MVGVHPVGAQPPVLADHGLDLGAHGAKRRVVDLLAAEAGRQDALLEQRRGHRLGQAELGLHPVARLGVLDDGRKEGVDLDTDVGDVVGGEAGLTAHLGRRLDQALQVIAAGIALDAGLQQAERAAPALDHGLGRRGTCCSRRRRRAGRRSADRRPVGPALR